MLGRMARVQIICLNDDKYCLYQPLRNEHVNIEVLFHIRYGELSCGFVVIHAESKRVCLELGDDNQ